VGEDAGAILGDERGEQGKHRPDQVMSELFLATVTYRAVLQSGHEAHIVADCVETRTDDLR
jgi:hypothetical protein